MFLPIELIMCYNFDCFTATCLWQAEKRASGLYRRLRHEKIIGENISLGSSDTWKICENKMLSLASVQIWNRICFNHNYDLLRQYCAWNRSIVYLHSLMVSILNFPLMGSVFALCVRTLQEYINPLLLWLLRLIDSMAVHKD